MIVRMKKISVIVQSKDIDPMLKSLAALGVLHVEHEKIPTNENIVSLQERHRVLCKAVEILPDLDKDSETYDKPGKLVTEILGLLDKKETLIEGIKNIKKSINIWKDWGDFDPEIVYELEAKLIWMRLCKLSKNDFRNIPEDVLVHELFKKGNTFYCVAISRKEIDLPFKVIQLPEQGLQEMLVSMEREEEKLKEIGEVLNNLSKYKNALISHKKELTSIIEFNKVSAGLGSSETLSYVKGYAPLDKVKLLEEAARDGRWGIIIEDPSETDNVPTLIKNPRWIEIIRPVFQMIGTIPGYKEVDISMWFLLFFSVFFGMLVGDAGYGAVFFIINLICHLKFGKRLNNKSVFFLTYVLSLCAILWGVLTGTFFGQAWLPQRIGALLPVLRENANVQNICFFIGAAHLSIAHIWRFIRKMPSVKAFSEAGWICMLWLAYFIARTLILGQVFPEKAKWLLIAGPALIILCTSPSRNIFKTIGSGIGGFLLNVVNSFTDVVSYIRLFAVGAATVAVADAFNHMASGIGHANIFAGFLAAFVLFFGHTLNILLGAMAILVHGVRLNVLEFSSHMNMEWSGIEYSPFKGKGD